MGISPFGRNSNCSCDKKYGDIKGTYADKSNTYQNPENPNPTNFEFVRSQQVGTRLVVEVRYPNCTNYEGRKIMVYDNTNIHKLCREDKLDPHFCDNSKHSSPIARFEPTERGWNLALKFAQLKAFE